jgi:hypothetical protein
MEIKDMPTEDIIKEWEACEEAIEVSDCFGVSDLLNRQLAEAELLRRGYKHRGAKGSWVKE